ncbi:ASCH domain-containing protein [Natranaeroarchaeum aerophilus]|uniref:ASCH domain-containing protein n=1 Tax=Natranaeroarchaeum aerophilus TaxID=2917711 RepID=A0AAE3K867_9EURY|nr:ASCH domain-containing protein [Natranaeroarchaeum aerophilus]MCL9814679.1 ASCH domain-containing protein [Natranaeroarchaeum aerophilus]
MAEIDAGTILPSDRMRQQALAGEVTQIHRGQAYAEEGDSFTIEDTTFEITAIEERRLGDMTDEDARAEGAADLDQYKSILQRAHENFEWDDDSEIVRHAFEPR